MVLIEGSLDTESAAKAMADSARGPHKYVSIVGGDRQFHDVRDIFFGMLAEALRWVEGVSPTGGISVPDVSPPAVPVPVGTPRDD